MINKKTLFNEVKDKQITSSDIDLLCADLAKKSGELYKWLEKHPNVDSDVLKKVKTIEHYYKTIQPIDKWLKKMGDVKRQKAKQRQIDEDVTVSANSTSDVQKKAAQLASAMKTNVQVVEGKTLRLKDVISENVLKGMKRF